MINALLSVLAPDYCCSCGEIGAILCDYCKLDIISEPYNACVSCGRPAGVATSLCTSCRMSYTRAWCVGERSEALKRLINVYKFERAKQAGRTCAELLDATLPHLPSSAQIVPIPTIPAHIRQRGYDHSVVMARSFASKRGLRYSPVLRRVNREGQRGANRQTRLAQAKRAFASRALDGGVYVLIDDVMTTGATMQFAAQTLRDAGADEVWVAVLAHQPLDSTS